ncbi:MAG: LPP20 family lipoprotein [Bacteroidales bacterium]|nr:LPP20 family lipoprotein [Bacteroidales bacterium]
MPKFYIFLFPLIYHCLALSGQSVEEIKGNSRKYIWGEGTGVTLNSADENALAQLISQIFVVVESRFDQEVVEMTEKGGENPGGVFKEVVRSLVSTYSAATLHNAERLVLQNEPDAKVFRYIERASIEKIFTSRHEKIIQFTETADRHAFNREVGDALRYYYWGLALLRSHPDGGAVKYTSGGSEVLLLQYLPRRINEIFYGLKFIPGEILDNPGYRRINLIITSENKPVANLDYSFWTGKDWSPLISVKDGWGFVEFFGDNPGEWEEIKIKVEYDYQRETFGDQEIKEVMGKIGPIPFRKAYFNVPLMVKEQTPQQEVEQAVAQPETLDMTAVVDGAPFKQTIVKVLESLKLKEFEQAEEYFTAEGFEVFNQLLVYGNASLIAMEEIRALQNGNITICRGPVMSFSFPNNRKKFVEDIVFHFNGNGKIQTLAFGLSEQSLNSILLNDIWSENEKLTLICFMEHYKTAYALKRLDYIESIFADDALIIVGNVVQVKTNPENPYSRHEIVRYNRYSKEQYMKNLGHCFRSNEFINIHFEECDIRKGGKNGNLFGIQIRQNYYSTNYSDQGYLFLMIDFSNSDEPLIHVRTWQPEKDPEVKIYGLESFN